MIIAGTALVIQQDNVDTDVLYPSTFCDITDPEEMALHLFEGVDPALRAELRGDTILCVGENFGCGSSREHVPQAMRAAGIRCILGKSFARIFYRNCINLGIPALACRDAVAAAAPGAHVRVNTESGQIEINGAAFQAKPMPRFILDMLGAGGLVEWGRRRLNGS